MAKLIVSLEGVVVKEVQITKDRITLGRRPYNDVVIDNLAVSGEHAVLQRSDSEVFIEDRNSTNGTYVNGRPIKRQSLQHNDTVEIGKYRISYLATDAALPSYAATSPLFAPSGFSPSGFSDSLPAPSNSRFGALHSRSGSSDSRFGSTSSLSAFGALSPVRAGSVKVLNGAAVGREVSLTKVVTTVGKPGVQVASITKRPGGYVFAHVEGAARPTVNGQPVMGEPVPLNSGDIIELAGTQMQFLQA